jgi:hypothetical protein
MASWQLKAFRNQRDIKFIDSTSSTAAVVTRNERFGGFRILIIIHSKLDVSAPRLCNNEPTLHSNNIPFFCVVVRGRVAKWHRV